MSSIATFIVLTSLLGPSIICTGFLFYHFMRSSQLRRKTQNFLVICLLVINFVQELIELPSRLYYLYTRTVLFPNPSFCNFWNWCQFSLASINLLLVSLGSIERYLLIFNHIFFTRHIILLRHIPLILGILIPSIFYAISIYAIQCETTFNYNSIGCGLPCSFYILKSVIILKNIILILLPVLLTILISCLLIVRICIQRRKMRRQRQFWKESIKMSTQLLPIVILYSVIWLPLSILFYFSTFGTSIQRTTVIPLINDYFGNFKYLVNLIYPFLVLFGQPELRKKILKFFCRSDRRLTQTVAPVIPLANMLY